MCAWNKLHCTTCRLNMSEGKWAKSLYYIQCQHLLQYNSHFLQYYHVATSFYSLTLTGVKPGSYSDLSVQLYSHGIILSLQHTVHPTHPLNYGSVPLLHQGTLFPALALNVGIDINKIPWILVRGAKCNNRSKRQFSKAFMVFEFCT